MRTRRRGRKQCASSSPASAAGEFSAIAVSALVLFLDLSPSVLAFVSSPFRPSIAVRNYSDTFFAALVRGGRRLSISFGGHPPTIESRSQRWSADGGVDSLFASSGGGDAPLSNVNGVTLKMAFDSSPHWAVADMDEIKSERFTCDASLDLVHRLRRVSDCVLVGRSTVERDDCTLTVRRVPLLEGRDQPVRVVIDPTLRVLTPPGNENGDEDGDGKQGYAMLRDGLPAIIYHSGGTAPPDFAPTSDSVALVDLSSSPLPGHEGGARFCDYIPPSAVLSDLSSRGINHVMVEGGPATALAFLNDKLVDRAIIIRAPVSFGVPVHSDISEETLEKAGLEKVGMRPCGEDLVHYWSRPGVPWPTEELMDWP